MTNYIEEFQASVENIPREPPQESKIWRNTFIFVSAYTLMHIGYTWVSFSFMQNVIHHYAVVLPCVDVIGWLAPNDSVHSTINGLASSRATLKVLRGCDGAGAMFLLVAAVFASDVAPKRVLKGIIGAVLVSYLLNEIRLIALYFIAAGRPEWFDVLHGYVIPLVVILISCLIFWAWLSGQLRAERVVSGTSGATSSPARARVHLT